MKTVIISLFVSLLFFGCGKKSADDYLKSAQKSVKANNITEAVDSYQKLVKNYPNNPKTPHALFELATLYQNKMVKSISAEESLEKSVQLFKSVFEKYPDSKIAPKSLFMSGFVQANDLKEYNKASDTFRLFLKKYPKHTLAASAKEELDNMGLSPEEILKKKSESSKNGKHS